MEKLLLHLCLCFSMFICSGCSNQSKVENDNMKSIALSEEILSKELFDHYLQLKHITPIETNDSCLVTSIRRMILHDGKMFILNDYREIVVINSATGDYLGRIRKIGNGPGEYARIMDFAICEDSDRIVIYSDRMKLLFYDYNLDFLSEQTTNDELYESITCSDNTLYFYNPMGTADKNMIATYNLNTKEWGKETGGTTCNFGYRLEGVPLVKSKSIWYAAPLESKLFGIDNAAVKVEYNILMDNFGSKDKLLSLTNPPEFFEYIAQNGINYALTSIKETSAFMYCKSNLYPFIVVDKELGKARYIRRLFDPALGASILKYIPNDNDDETVIFTLSAEDWIHAVNRQNIPAEIANQLSKRKVDGESNCLLLFYSERNRHN